jgi:serine/threonine-protein kinase
MGEEIQVKVLDFGIAKTRLGDGGAATTQGQVFGSPAYMSPEQARAGQVDQRSDLWSLGALLYEMITGSAPFTGASPSDIVVKLCTEEPIPASQLRPEIGADWDTFFQRALARDVERRFQSVDELISSFPQVKRSDAERLAQSGVPRQPGRREETAPLASDLNVGRVAQQVNREGRESERGRALSLRPSLLPERRPASTMRGVLAVSGILLLLGLIGIWMNHQARSRSASNQSIPQQTNAGRAPSMAASREEILPTSPSSAVVAPLSPAGQAAGVSPEPRPEAGGEGADDPARERPRPGNTPVPSRPRKPPVEPTTDPVFGLPVGSP